MRSKKIHIEDISKENIFSVPDQYFESAAKELYRSRSVIQTVSKASIYTVPDTYFENLSRQIDQKIHHKWSLENVLPDASWPLPEHYFNQLPTLVQAKLQKKNRIAFPYFGNVLVGYRYAAVAAILIVIIGIGYQYKTTDACQAYLCNVERSDIKNYVHDHLEDHHEAITESAYSSTLPMGDQLLKEIKSENIDVEIDYTTIQDEI